VLDGASRGYGAGTGDGDTAEPPEMMSLEPEPEMMLEPPEIAPDPPEMEPEPEMRRVLEPEMLATVN
jgi:hypothetical protein